MRSKRTNFLLQDSMTPIQIAAKWDNFDKGYVTPDIDITVVMIDMMGKIVDAVYYNKLVSDCKSIRHSGDNKDGKLPGFDEVITINL